MTSSDQEEILCFEKLVDLSQCSFIGMTVSVGHSILANNEIFRLVRRTI